MKFTVVLLIQPIISIMWRQMKFSLLGSQNGRLCMYILTALGVFACFSALMSLSNLKDPIRENMDHSLFHEAQNRSNVPGGAFVFLALGAQANQMNCPAAVESLVRYSGWDGDVYLVTDQRSCFDEGQIVRNAGMRKDRFHYVVVEDNFNHGGFDFQHPKVGFRKARVRSLNMKTKLFELIPDPRIQTIAYVDCDIVFTQPQCAQSFLTTGPDWTQFPIRFSHVFRDSRGELQDIHAGSFVVHREHSQQALQLWRRQIELGTDDGDNDAYMRLYRENEARRTGPTSPQTTPPSTLRDTNEVAQFFLNQKSGPANPLEPGEITKSLSTDYADQRNWFEKFLELENRRPFCMQHIPKARCARYGRKRVQEFVDRLQLRTYMEGQHMYCVSAFLRPLLYGWFPLGYLPFCPKLEQIL